MIFATSKCEVTRCKETCPLFGICLVSNNDRHDTRLCPGRKINNLPPDFKYPKNWEELKEVFVPVQLADGVSVEVQVETVIEKFCSYACQKGHGDARSCECGWDSTTECEYNDRDGRPTDKCPIYDLPAGEYEYKVEEGDIVRTGDCNYEDFFCSDDK